MGSRTWPSTTAARTSRTTPTARSSGSWTTTPTRSRSAAGRRARRRRARARARTAARTAARRRRRRTKRRRRRIRSDTHTHTHALSRKPFSFFGPLNHARVRGRNIFYDVHDVQYLECERKIEKATRVVVVKQIIVMYRCTPVVTTLRSATGGAHRTPAVVLSVH